MGLLYSTCLLALRYSRERNSTRRVDELRRTKDREPAAHVADEIGKFQRFWRGFDGTASDERVWSSYYTLRSLDCLFL
jgi:hypothetical protein